VTGQSYALATYHRQKSLPWPLDWRLGGPHSRSECFTEDKSLSPRQESNHDCSGVQHTAPSHTNCTIFMCFTPVRPQRTGQLRFLSARVLQRHATRCAAMPWRGTQIKTTLGWYQWSWGYGSARTNYDVVRCVVTNVPDTPAASHRQTWQQYDQILTYCRMVRTDCYWTRYDGPLLSLTPKLRHKHHNWQATDCYQHYNTKNVTTNFSYLLTKLATRIFTSLYSRYCLKAFVSTAMRVRAP
jgi:uncharacterized protein Usg